ncbi:MAG TPA: hypothetical protein VNE16_16665, partial [Vicinamibacterales bacterium]|nr:hypothetical protein [Vicinamibacterales bacterium]
MWFYSLTFLCKEERRLGRIWGSPHVSFERSGHRDFGLFLQISDEVEAPFLSLPAPGNPSPPHPTVSVFSPR